MSTDVSRPCRARAISNAAPGDPLDLGPRVLAGVEPGSVVAGALLAEVEPADELADDHEVDPGRPRLRRPEVRVDAELLAERQEALLRPHRLPFELRQPDRRRAGRRPPTGTPRASRPAAAASPAEDRVATEGMLGVLDPERVEDADRLGGHLGADPVTGKDGDVRHAMPCALVGGDLVLVLQRERDLVETVQEPGSRRLVEVERDVPPVGSMIVRRSRSTVISAPASGSTIPIRRFTSSAGSVDRDQADLRGVRAEDVAERRRDDDVEAVVLERPGGMLARRPAAEVATGQQDRRAGVHGSVELELGSWLAVLVEAPVEEQELPVAGPLDPLQERLRDDLVGVDVGAVEHRDAPGRRRERPSRRRPPGAAGRRRSGRGAAAAPPSRG